MDLRFQKRSIDLIFKMFVKGDGMPGVIKFTPQKTEWLERVTSAADSLERSSPEAQGVERERIDRFISEMEADRDIHLHTMVILRGGRLICSGGREPYSPYQPKLVYSMSKTVIGIAIGMLVAEGKLSLDRRAYSFFSGDRLPLLLTPRTKAITVEHLLTMRTGVNFNEVGAVTEEDWVRSYFDSAVKFEPGSDFAYNSMNSYILSAIIQAVTGKTVNEYLTSRLWEPLDIRSHFWECCPMGIPKGGWGLYLTTFDMAKLGLLMLRGGRWGEKQILSAEWVERMTKSRSSTPEDSGEYDYGYHMWVKRKGGSYLFNGLFGQNVWVCPETDTVVATTGGNCELFQSTAALSLTDKYFSDPGELGKTDPEGGGSPYERPLFEGRRWITPPPAERRGLFGRLFASKRRTQGLPEEAAAYLGSYTFEKNNAGLLPMMMRLFQNNHSAGTNTLSLFDGGDRISVRITEGEAEYEFDVGLGRFIESRLDYNGEKYILAAAAETAVNEDGERLLKVELAFPELPMFRRAKLYLEGDRLSLRIFDLPGRKLIPQLLDSMAIIMPKNAAVADFAKNRLNFEYISYKITDVFERKLNGKRC